MDQSPEPREEGRIWQVLTLPVICTVVPQNPMWWFGVGGANQTQLSEGNWRKRGKIIWVFALFMSTLTFPLFWCRYRRPLTLQGQRMEDQVFHSCQLMINFIKRRQAGRAEPLVFLYLARCNILFQPECLLRWVPVSSSSAKECPHLRLELTESSMQMLYHWATPPYFHYIFIEIGLLYIV